MNLEKILLITEEQEFMNELTSLFREYNPHQATSIQQGVEFLKSNIYTVLITDINLNMDNGIEFIRKVKNFNKDTSIIIVVDEHSYSQTVDAFDYGSFNFFTKPIDKNEISNSVKEILKMKAILQRTRDIDYYLVSTHKVYKIPNDINLISDLASTISRDLIINQQCDDDEIISIDLALVEMITNAIEHGNLEINDLEKAELIYSKGNKYASELENRSKQEPYCSRTVTVEAFYDREKVKYVIIDQGKGFDYETIKNNIEKRDLLRISGRGIIMTYATMDEVVYEPPGNKVTLIKYFACGKQST